jgi:tRNA dimethylallyltransferase
MWKNFNAIILTGPTATGKTKLSIKIAKKLLSDGLKVSIINCDSKQVYSQVPIITAQPTDEEKCGIEHNLFGFLSNSQCIERRYTANNWVLQCEDILQRNQKNDVFSIIVGGTMFYINCLLNGICISPQITKQTELEAQMQYNTLGHERFIDFIKKYDKNLKTDKHRLIKNYCFIKTFGYSADEFYKNPQNNFQIKYDTSKILKLTLLPQRDQIYKWCNNRFLDMIKLGVVDEVKNLIETQDQISSAINTSSGFKYIVDFLHNNCDKDYIIEKSSQDTRNYAKRQITWINNKLNKGFKVFESDIDVVSYLNNI